MKCVKLLNLIPLVLFFIMDFLGFDSGLSPLPAVVIVFLVVLNVMCSGSMKEYILSSVLLLVSTVIGMILDTYYYYYFVSSDFETPIVGAFITIVYAILVVVLVAIGTVFFVIKEKNKEKSTLSEQKEERTE